MRRLLEFVGGSFSTRRASARSLETAFGELVLRESRMIRLIGVVASVAGYLVASIYGVLNAWTSTPLYSAALCASAATLLIMLLLPTRANVVMTMLFLPASAGTCTPAPCRAARPARMTAPPHAGGCVGWRALQ